MQSANILLSLGGDSGNQVPKYDVTAAEIAVLRAIHGEDAVTDIQPVPDKVANQDTVKRGQRAELARLRAIYGRATDGENNVVLDMLFPGAAARVFETIDELDLDPSFFAAKDRVTTADFGGNGDHDGDGNTGGAAPAQGDGLSALTVPKLRELADERGIDLGTATKKAEIIAAIEAAQPDIENETSDQDDVADMDDAGKPSIFG